MPDSAAHALHRRAVARMVLVTLMWSIAGIVSRQLHDVQGLEVSFWRSLVTALVLTLYLRATRRRSVSSQLREAGALVWLSGVFWAVMYLSFMVAMMMTTVAHVLVTMAAGPLMTALLARALLHHRLPVRTWVAIGVAGAGMVWMFWAGLEAASGAQVLGKLLALAVPLGGALNWTVMHKARQGGEADGAGSDGAPDMTLALWIGAVLSALVALPFALPWHASGTDWFWLAVLGVVQLGIPCIIVIGVTRVLAAPEIALLDLLEVIFGITWTWLGAGEQPAAATLGGGALVVGALMANEWLGWRRRQVPAGAVHA